MADNHHKLHKTMDLQLWREYTKIMRDDVKALRLYFQRRERRPANVEWQLFFHYTCQHWLPLIFKQGLVKGDVAVSNTGGFDAPWLTTDQTPDRIGVIRPKEMGESPNADKTRFRLTVKIPRGDRNLWRWTELAKALKVPKEYQQRMVTAANGDGKSWYVYLGVIPPEWILIVEERNGSGFIPVDQNEFL